jgi:hypothetical protein
MGGYEIKKIGNRVMKVSDEPCFENEYGLPEKSLQDFYDGISESCNWREDDNCTMTDGKCGRVGCYPTMLNVATAAGCTELKTQIEGEICKCLEIYVEDAKNKKKGLE